MNSDISNIFYERAKLIENLDRIIGSSKKSKTNLNQLSLFDVVEDVEVKMNEPKDFNPIEMSQKEKEVLGFHMTYSPFEEYEIIRCRYCDSNLYSILQEEIEFGNKSLLAEIRNIEYRTSKFGNPYAKIIFGDETGEERFYVTGRIYKKNIAKSFVGQIYLLTVNVKQDKSVEIVDYQNVREVNANNIGTRAYFKCNMSMIPTLRMYTKVFMAGDSQEVIVKIADADIVYRNIGRVSVDNANLVEMRKSGIEVKLR